MDKNFIAENWKSSFDYQKVNAVGVTKSLIEGIGVILEERKITVTSEYE